MGPAQVVGCFTAGSQTAFHGQNNKRRASSARIITPSNQLLHSGRLRGTTSLQVAQPAGELCMQASSSSSTVTISREDTLPEAQTAKGPDQISQAGRSAPNEPEEQASFRGRVATVTFQGRTGREGSFGLQIDSNRSRLRRQRFAELRTHMDQAINMQPILVGRRRQIIEDQKKQAEDAQRRKIADAQKKKIDERARSDVGPSSIASSRVQSTSTRSGSSSGKIGTDPLPEQSSSFVEPSAGESSTRGKGISVSQVQPRKAGPQPKGTIPKDAVGNVVVHNLDLKPSKTTKVIPEGFAIKIQPGIVLPILPNVMAVSGGLGREELEDFASQRVLSSLLTLDVPKELCTMSLADRDTSAFKDSVQYKVAALTRIMKRAALKHKPNETIVLLQCASSTLTPVAQLMAAWLHWQGQMDVQEACDRASSACGCHISRDFIDRASNDLYESAQIRRNRNYLVWPHGAFQAQVAGDVVGSWFPATSMRKVTVSDAELWDLNPGDWVLPISEELEPGVHRYKYVIDDSWRMDWHQPFDHDGSSNRNNLWFVSSNIPPSQHVPEDRLQVIRKELISLALRVKMRLGPKMLSK